MPGLLTDQEYQAQFRPGRGVSMKWGPRPPTADEVAPRGTPEWRAAWQAMDAWRGNNLKAGATAFDLGLRDQKELGKHFFTRMRMGEVDPRARGNWIRDANGAEGYFARGSYLPNNDTFMPRGGTLGNFAGMNTGFPGGGGPGVAPPSTFGGGMTEPPPAPGMTTNTYGPFSGGGRRRKLNLRGFAGG